MKIVFYPAFFLAFLSILSGCSLEKYPRSTYPVRNRYSGCGSAGDILRSSFYIEEKSFVFSNDTAGTSDSGSYSIMEGYWDNAIRTGQGMKLYYAVDYSGKLCVANFPSGNVRNDLAIGISSWLDYRGYENYIVGDYTFIVLGTNAVNGGTNFREWGMVSINADGTWVMTNFSTGGAGPLPVMLPEDFTLSLPLTVGLSGTWAVDTYNPERIVWVTNGGSANPMTGFVYSSYHEAVFLLNRGNGNGFLMGLKNPLVHYTPTNIAGEYQLADVWTGGSRTKGAVFFQINSNGLGGYYRRVDEDGLTNERYLTNLNTCMGLPNAFSFSFLEAGSAGFADDHMVYMFFSSNVIMELVMDVSSNFISYGAGARKR